MTSQSSDNNNPPDRIVTAGVAIKNNKILVGLRKIGGAAGGKWEFPGGKQESGESPEQALVREWKEELDADIKVEEFVASRGFTNKGTRYLLMAFRVVLTNSDIRNIEHVELKWVTSSELHTLDLTDSDRALLPEITKLL